MALFRRNAPDSSAPPARASVASIEESAQLRGRARRRLVGAVALVLAAVIVLPMALDSEPIPVASDIPIVIPDRASSYQPQFAQTLGEASAEPAGTGQAQTVPTPASNTTTRTTNNASATTAATPSAASGTARPTTTHARTGSATTANTASGTATTTPSRPAAAANTSTTPSTTPPSTTIPPARSDDGSRALALLEGRASGYVLQIAAYSNQSDAQARRDQLVKAGVANAFVAQATVNGKTQYRLRVGPFASRDAAQAAQPGLRKLGYDNGFIAAQ